MHYSKKIHNAQKRHTRKIYPRHSKIHGNIISKKEGWIILHIYGNPYERGFAHGKLLCHEIKKLEKAFPFIVETQLKQSFSDYLKACKTVINPIVKKDYPEFYEEIKGIADGCNSTGHKINVDYLIAWNAVLSMYLYFKKKDAYKCSAFIATGDATEKGTIVMGHNTHADFVTGQYQNIILYITPDEGFPFVMQTAPGYIASGIDWFICSTGIIGCETTISLINYEVNFGAPYFCRIRQAMQYGKTLDDYVSIMLKNNAGDYACSWLFGNINTNEIMLFDIGLKEHHIERTHNGVYFGMNTAIDFKFRSLETTDTDLYNLETSSGSRNSRLDHLLNEVYYGKINRDNGKKILSDHYDSSLGKNVMNSRSICKHSELEYRERSRLSYYPFGSTDGKVVDSTMAKRMKFEGRFGSSCGRVFNASEHIKKHPEYKKWEGILEDLPKRKWITIHGDS
jgi:hypothetical protein